MHDTTHDQIAAVRAAVESNPGVYTVTLAQELGISEVQVIEALPSRYRVKAPTHEFEAIWQEMTTWESVTFVVSSAGMIGEITGRLPKGTHGRGMYNLHEHGCPLGGHFRIDMLGSIWLLDKPFMGHDSKGVFFFDKFGNRMCAVYVGRDEVRHELLPSVLQKFKLLWLHYASENESDT